MWDDWSGNTPLMPLLVAFGFGAFILLVSRVLGRWHNHNDEVIRRAVWKPGEDPLEPPEITAERLENIRNGTSKVTRRGKI